MVQLTIQQAFDLAVQHHQAGRLREAEALLRQILAAQPDHAGALHHLGVIAHQVGRSDISIDLIRRATVVMPNYAEAHCNLGNVLKDTGRLDEAIAAYRQAVAVRPDFAEANFNLGIALQDKLQFDEAMVAYRQAILLNPNHAGAHLNLGNVLKEKERLDEAITVYRQALSLNPNWPDPHNNLGASLQYIGQFDAALAAYRQAIALKPDFVDAHWNLARLLLLTGQFAEGWDEFEWRLQLRSVKLDRDFPQPHWNGAEIPGQTLLIYTEGGFGDAFNFVRLVPLIRARVGKVILECQPELMRLFADIPGVDQLVVRGEALPSFDCRIALQSLPRILAIGLQNIPNTVPYLKAPREAVEFWRHRIPRDGIKNVGLCWAGSPHETKHRTRTIDLFAPLVRVPGIRFFSLQKGPDANQKLPEGMELIDHNHELNDFADTAALIENLDLVITVDTSIAHLAGALAKPVWVLIPKSADFRWLLDRSDSPWYPTMRLFRQQARGNWDDVIAQVAGELAR